MFPPPLYLEETMEKRIQTLKRLLRELGKIHASLSATKEECSGCGAQRYLSWDEAQAKKAVEGAITRVDRATDHLMSLERKTE
jgi:ribosome-associated translation inhibitor RaiA